MSGSGQPLRIALVGHTNAGKTSLLQTLLRRRDIGEVSPHSGTTRKVEEGEVADDDGVVAVLLDTPGIEESERLWTAMESGRTNHREDQPELLGRFLASPAAADIDDLGLEAESVRAALGVDVLLYAIDVRDEPKQKHIAELEVLKATGRPLIPIFNYVAHPDARPESWRDTCARRSLHATVDFDAVVYDDAGEKRLLDALRTNLAPGHEAVLDRWRTLREHERDAAIAAAIEVAGEFLVTAAAAVVVTEPESRDETARQLAFRKATELLGENLRKRETVARYRIAETLGFHGDEARAVTFVIEDALGGVDFLSPGSLERAGWWAAGGIASGAATGAIFDTAVGGVSLGGFAALGAIGAVLGAAGANARKVRRRLRGQEEVRLGDAGVELLAVRAVATIRALLARGHAARAVVDIGAAVKESLERGADPAWRKSWVAARGRAEWSELFRPCPSSVAREKVVRKVTTALANRIHQESSQ